MENNICIITSVIDTPNKPLSYTRTRSVYNIDDRFEQTKKTIFTIKNKIPNVKILLIECSNIHNTIYESYFKQLCDFYINLFDNETLRNNIFGISKSLGEGTMTIEALKYILNSNIEFDNLFKMSARYELTEKFQYDNYANSHNIFKKINDENNIFTAFYKLNIETSQLLYEFLVNNTNLMHNCIGYEVLFGLFLKHIQYKNVIFLSSVGFYGLVSVDGTVYYG